MSDLVVVLNGILVGAVTHRAGRSGFSYLNEYATGIDPTPLSLSMPLIAGRIYDHRVTGPWLMNLLPDDANVRERLARDFGARGDSATELLAHIGRDCAGAVQLALLEEVDDVADGE